MPQACFYLLLFISACSAKKVTTKIKKIFCDLFCHLFEPPGTY